jgi:hypothetical protein
VLHGASAEPGELASEALATLAAEYEETESEAVSEQIGGQAVSGYDLSFFYLDLTNTALIRAFRAAGATCLVLCQAEDREYEHVGAVFRAITTSLLTNDAGS